MVDGTRALVTGGAGFIGSHLVDALLDAGAARVAVVDNLFLGDARNLERSTNLHADDIVLYREDSGDLPAMSEVVRREQPDVVFNLATKALLYSFFNPAGAYRVNVEIALTLCELLRAGSYGRLVHVSSSEVYGSAQTVPMAEDHPLLAETTYAAGKAAADLALASYVRMFGLDAVTVRPFNNFGPRQNDAGSLAAVIPLTVRRVLEGQAPVVEGDGLQTRDFTYVGDTIDALLRIAATPMDPGALWNLGSGRETAIGTLVAETARLAGWTGEIERRPARAADVRRHCADVSQAEAVIGPVAKTSLEDGLRTTVEWYLARAQDDRA